MKFRYIYEQYGEIYGTNSVTKEHLANVLQRRSDFLIDISEGCWFDAKNNEWKKIEGQE